MDEDGFRTFLRKKGKKSHVTDGLVRQVKHFEQFLFGKNGNGLSLAVPQDILDYAATLENLHTGSAAKGIRGLALYFIVTT